MGFGTLFIGYFLLLNIVYPGFSNIIAALIMMMGLYKLSAINKPFRYALYICIGFAVFSLADLVVTVLFMFMPRLADNNVSTYMTMVRLLLTCILTVAFLSGIQEVSREVDLERIPKRSKYFMYATFAVYMLYMVLTLPAIAYLMPAEIMATLYVLTIFALFAVIILNLYVIFTCYARIGMPGEEKNRGQNPSRFGFVNEYRKHKAEKEQEYAEYKLERYRQKQAKKKGKKK